MILSHLCSFESEPPKPSYDVLLSIARNFKVSTDFLLGIEKKNDIDLSGLTDEKFKAIKNLIKSMQGKNNF